MGRCQARPFGGAGRCKKPHDFYIFSAFGASSLENFLSASFLLSFVLVKMAFFVFLFLAGYFEGSSDVVCSLVCYV